MRGRASQGMEGGKGKVEEDMKVRECVEERGKNEACRNRRREGVRR